jgi:Holliday junction resolvase-like predicted endonuclease
VTAQTRPPMFPIRSEEDLEDYLEAHPSLTGQNLLIIGRQVNVAGGIIDLLAIDATGVIFIVELKLGKALPATIAQILGYRRSIRRLDRKMIIRLAADGVLRMDLAQAFQRHFGRPLPETVNEAQLIILIAASVHPMTAGGILALLDDGYSITTFRYVAQADAVSLIPCCRSDRDVEERSHLATRPLASSNRVFVLPTGSGNYPVDETIRRFWLTHVRDFDPFVTFSFIFERYESWVRGQSAEGAPLHQRGLFGRHLSAITAASNEWTRVFVDRHSDMAAYNTFVAPPATQPYHGGDYTVAAYKRNPIGPASEL